MKSASTVDPRERRKGASPKAKVRAAYDAVAPVYEQRWFRYVTASAEAALARLSLTPGERVLDVGCGTGLLLAQLLARHPDAELAGIDLSPAMLRHARARLPARVRLVAADAEALPFAAASFDVVVSSSSFHYWPAPERGLDELGRVLRPGGRVVLTDWCDDYLACRLCDRLLRWADPAHRRIYGRRECAGLLTTSGYEVDTVESYRISWLWGLMTAVAHVRE